MSQLRCDKTNVMYYSAPGVVSWMFSSSSFVCCMDIATKLACYLVLDEQKPEMNQCLSFHTLVEEVNDLLVGFK